MSNLHDDNSITALVTRPPSELQPRDISTLQASLLAGAAYIAEFAIYEEASALAMTDTPAAHRMLLDMEDEREIMCPQARFRLMTLFTSWMDAREGRFEPGETHRFDTVQSRAGDLQDRTREAAFRAAPGRFLPGARTSSIRLLKDDGFGLVSHAGREWAWTYAAAGMARSDLGDLVAFVDDMRLLPLAGGILVGPPEVAEEVTLPEGWLFVAIELGNTGRAA